MLVPLTKSFLLVLALCFSATRTSSAFVLPSRCFIGATTSTIAATTSPTQLSERRWNFNEGQGPFGLKKNAEIWNGRVAQMAFVLVFIQELVQGKGVIQGLQEGNPVNIAVCAAFGISMVGITAFLAVKGTDDYVARDLMKDE